MKQSKTNSNQHFNQHDEISKNIKKSVYSASEKWP